MTGKTNEIIARDGLVILAIMMVGSAILFVI